MRNNFSPGNHVVFFRVRDNLGYLAEFTVNYELSEDQAPSNSELTSKLSFSEAMHEALLIIVSTFMALSLFHGPSSWSTLHQQISSCEPERGGRVFSGPSGGRVFADQTSIFCDLPAPGN